MSAQRHLTIALNAFPSSRNFPAEGETVRAALPPGDLTLTLAAIDSIGCSLHRLAYAAPELATATIAQLQAVSSSLALRVRYLLEPIGPIEIDAERAIVQMRSLPPHRREGTSAYFELLVQRGGQVSLVRFEKASGRSRAAVPFALTREMLFRLADDFHDAVAEMK